jgi:hypothetical protein
VAAVDGNGAGAPTGGTAPRRFGPLRAEIRALVELVAAAGFAVTIPMLNLLAANAGIFVSRRASTLDVLVVALVALLVLPAVAWAVEVTVGLVLPAARRWVHAALIGLGVGVWALQFVKSAFGAGPAVMITVAVVVGLGAAALRIRSTTFAAFVLVLAVAPVFVTIWFVALSPAHRAVSSSSVSASGVRIANPHRVVLLTLDELPIGSLLDGTGHVDAELFPNLAALERTSTSYRNMSTVAPYTELAIPAILTGQYPTAGKLPVVADHPDSIFRLLSGTYRVNAHDDITSLCSTGTCPTTAVGGGHRSRIRGILDQGTTLWRNSVALHPAKSSYAPPIGIPDPAIESRRFVSSLTKGDRPTFDYGHVMLPHQPFRYFSTFQFHRPLVETVFDTANFPAWNGEGDAAIAREMHLLQLQAADTIVGQVRARLEKIGAWDDAIVVITADHGITFRPDEAARTVSDANAADILFPPLFIKAPGQTTGAVDDHPMRTIDILPTIAEMLGAKIPWKIDGLPASAPRRADEPIRLYQWPTADIQLPGSKLAKPGEYLTFPRAPLQAAAVAVTAAPAGGDPALRPFRIGPYGSLIGQPVASQRLAATPAPGELYIPSGSASLSTFDASALDLHQTWQEGYYKGAGGDRTLAFALNGRIAGIGTADKFKRNDDAYYYALLAPTLFAPTGNRVEAFVVTGPADAPVLTPVRIGN